MPTEAIEIIKFLNSKTREELEDLKIEDRTETIIEVKRVLTKRGLMLQLEEKVQAMDIGVQRFFSKIEALQKKGLPGLRVINDKLMTLSDYKKKLATMAKDSSKLGNTRQYHRKSILRIFPVRHQHIARDTVHFHHEANFCQVYRDG